jgi:hypothetical protein
MIKKESNLNDIFAEMPEMGKPAERVSVDKKTQEAFDNVNAFFTTHGREPRDEEGRDYDERSLAKKLTRIRSQTGMSDCLRGLDIHGLLFDNTAVDDGFEFLREADIEPDGAEQKRPLDTDPIIASEAELAEAPSDLAAILDLMDVVDYGTADIFNMRFVQTYDKTFSSSDYTSQRKPCPNFHEYKPLFDRVNIELKNGLREPLQFQNEQEVKQGQFFILNGIMVFVAEVGEPFEKNGKKNARLKVIFSNGTQGENLLRSLATELYKDPNGRRISNPRAGGLFSGAADDDDIGTGVVYVLQSLSTHPSIAEKRAHLHKIGVTKGSVQRRISNAENEATYLLAPVKVIAEFEIYNIKAQFVEKLLHAYFDNARAEITIPDRFNKLVKSREWFLVPPSAIKDAVDRLIDGSLGDTVFDPMSGRLVSKIAT